MSEALKRQLMNFPKETLVDYLLSLEQVDLLALESIALESEIKELEEEGHRADIKALDAMVAGDRVRYAELQEESKAIAKKQYLKEERLKELCHEA